MNTVPSVKEYTAVFIALMALLALTFFMARVDLGPFNVTVSLLIAAAKAILVAIFFMHLKTAHGVTRVTAFVGLFWLGILIILSLSDYLSRSWLLLPGPWPINFP